MENYPKVFEFVFGQMPIAQTPDALMDSLISRGILGTLHQTEFRLMVVIFVYAAGGRGPVAIETLCAKSGLDAAGVIEGMRRLRVRGLLGCV